MKSYFKWLFNGTWLYILQDAFHLICAYIYLFLLWIELVRCECEKCDNADKTLHLHTHLECNAFLKPISTHFAISIRIGVNFFHSRLLYFFLGKIIHQMWSSVGADERGSGQEGHNERKLFRLLHKMCALRTSLWTCAHKFVLARCSVFILENSLTKLTLLKKRAAKSRPKWFICPCRSMLLRIISRHSSMEP